jgi:hypothetical protein
MKPGDTIKRIKDPRSWAPIGFITKCCLKPDEPNPELVDITQPYGFLGYTALDGAFVFIYGMDNWEVVDGEPPLYFNRIDYSAPDIVVPNVKQPVDEITGLPMALMDDVAAIAVAHDEIQAQKDKLYDIVIKWRDENNVWDGEVIALYDHVRETFDDLVHELIRTVGYAPYKEEEDQ